MIPKKKGKKVVTAVLDNLLLTGITIATFCPSLAVSPDPLSAWTPTSKAIT
jgi:hypothetical protein